MTPTPPSEKLTIKSKCIYGVVTLKDKPIYEFKDFRPGCWYYLEGTIIVLGYMVFISLSLSIAITLFKG